MALFLDSARLKDAQRVEAMGFVEGITTNPALLARSTRPTENLIRRLCKLRFRPVFYQLTAPTLKGRIKEARRILNLHESVGLKIPATIENMALLNEFEDEAPLAVTAVYSAHQAYIAALAGADYVIPYVNRATRQLGDGPGLVAEIRQILDAMGAETEILAASLKSPEEVVATKLAGAHHLSLPLDLILALGNHPLSEQAIAEFARYKAESPDFGD
ncbi:MAG: transaldolase family protein [Anaerolineae bacterium]